MNYDELESQAATMAANAKNGTLTHRGHKYTMTFSPGWVYEVTDQNGDVVTRFNTKKLSTARQWLREYLEN
jgi:hypothetical protein